jgi:hypothetical protein
MPKGRIDVEVYFDSDGNRTCATNFENGSVCEYYRTQRFGTRETCVFAPREKKYAEQIRRRGDDGKGMLIPPDWCPIVVEGNI